MYPNNWFSNGKLLAILLLSVAIHEILIISNSSVAIPSVYRLNAAEFVEDIACLKI